MNYLHPLDLLATSFSNKILPSFNRLDQENIFQSRSRQKQLKSSTLVWGIERPWRRRLWRHCASTSSCCRHSHEVNALTFLVVFYRMISNETWHNSGGSVVVATVVDRFDKPTVLLDQQNSQLKVECEIERCQIELAIILLCCLSEWQQNHGRIGR